MRSAQQYLEEQKRTPSHFRNIAGPSFDGEFDSDLQDDVELKNKKHLAQYKHLHKDDRPDLDTAYQTVLFEEWVFEMNSKEVRFSLLESVAAGADSDHRFDTRRTLASASSLQPTETSLIRLPLSSTGRTESSTLATSSPSSRLDAIAKETVRTPRTSTRARV